jgi:hypothetical protein
MIDRNPPPYAPVRCLTGTCRPTIIAGMTICTVCGFRDIDEKKKNQR